MPMPRARSANKVTDSAMRRTKTIGTLGPASSSLKTVAALIRAGMNVARLYFSHVTHEDHLRVLDTVRRAASDLP
jgi:pyruvate kinase